MARLLALIGAESLAVLLLWRVGSWTGDPRLGDIEGWLATTPLETAVAALVRAAALAGAAWVLASTGLAVLAEVPGCGALRPFVRRVSLPLVRRIVEGAFAVTLTVGAMTGPAMADVRAEVPRSAVTTVASSSKVPRLSPATTDVSESSSAAAAAPTTCEVRAGDSLWRIAQRTLGDGRRYTDIWRANRGRVLEGRRFSDPNRIHPAGCSRSPPRKRSTAP